MQELLSSTAGETLHSLKFADSVQHIQADAEYFKDQEMKTLLH